MLDPLTTAQKIEALEKALAILCADYGEQRHKLAIAVEALQHEHDRATQCIIGGRKGPQWSVSEYAGRVRARTAEALAKIKGEDQIAALFARARAEGEMGAYQQVRSWAYDRPDKGLGDALLAWLDAREKEAGDGTAKPLA